MIKIYERIKQIKRIIGKNNIDYTNKSIIGENDGIDIDYKDYEISVISHPFSYGGNRGLLEIMASFIENEVKGYLTAEEVMKEIKTLGGLLQSEQSRALEY